MPDTIIMANAGKLLVAKWWQGLGPAPGANLTLHLFQNVFVPDADTPVTDFQECAFLGYAPRQYTYGQFSNPVLVAGKYELILGNTVSTWTAGFGGGLIAGWYLIDDASGKLLWHCKYAPLITLGQGGIHTVQVTIRTGDC